MTSVVAGLPDVLARVSPGPVLAQAPGRSRWSPGAWRAQPASSVTPRSDSARLIGSWIMPQPLLGPPLRMP